MADNRQRQASLTQARQSYLDGNNYESDSQGLFSDLAGRETVPKERSGQKPEPDDVTEGAHIHESEPARSEEQPHPRI